MPAVIKLHSGLEVDLLSMSPADVHIEDIAHALSNICRFGGHTRRFYSVAQHSVRVSNMLPYRLKLHGLLHDAAEAYVGDMVSPLKDNIPIFRNIEKRILDSVCRRFDIDPAIMPCVKWADRAAFNLEARGARDGDYLRCWTPKVAKECFLSEYGLLK